MKETFIEAIKKLEEVAVHKAQSAQVHLLRVLLLQ